MAQTAVMGPPPSLRETRRSGRRSGPSASTSKSPDSTTSPSDTTATKPTRPPLSTANSSKNKRFKQEDLEQSVDDNGVARATSPTVSPTSGRAKRKGKDKHSSTKGKSSSSAVPEPDEGITRCVCGSTEDDPDAGEFMVQCETCKAWQHGLCMGYESEEQLHDDDYYCEQCRPELHTELLKKLSTKKTRHSSVASHPASMRHSRSHSPSIHPKQPSKRRNTMNSRDAAFDQSLQEIIEATAAEAAAIDPGPTPQEDKKRKRTDDDPSISISKKRTRSASTASSRHPAAVQDREETPTSAGPAAAPTPTPIPAPSAPPAPPSKPIARNKRGGRKPAAAAATHEPSIDVEDTHANAANGNTITTTTTNKRQSRAKGVASANTPASRNASANHDHGTRKNQHQNANVNANGASGGNGADGRAYRNSHAYVVSQQPLLTTWGLPDYLAHLEPMLPSETPEPLKVRSALGFSNPSTAEGSNGGSDGGVSVERGVKVKWPSKRMSVGDMNKRVRALVEWVGREQASASERGRRKEALEKALAGEDIGREMILDGDITATPPAAEDSMQVDGDATTSTMKLMENLMEELIGFQERFGPGAKTRDRDRRATATAA